ncbi:hypothetical protein J4E06_06860 [Muricauda sp. NFXS6]|uniref:hypothetical protein n=1 Tax=Allomuricauda sp. NFXS6 TaxID=2819094 RepID=UPI0032DEA823
MYRFLGLFFLIVLAPLLLPSCSREPIGQGGGLLTYRDIRLGGVALQDSLGACFSTAKGTVVRAYELDGETGPGVDIVFVGLPGVRFFESPDGVSYWGLDQVPGARPTIFMHLEAEGQEGFTISDFDRMIDDSLLRALDITADQGALPLDGLPFLVLFENTDGKKGALKIHAMKKAGKTSEIIFDLKMQP